MAKGQRSENDQSRVGTREAWESRPTRMYAADLNEYGYGTEMSSTATPGGHVARVEHVEPPIMGASNDVYQAGPFSTPLRSQIAAESLSRRITQRGGADAYRQRPGPSFIVPPQDREDR